MATNRTDAGRLREQLVEVPMVQDVPTVEELAERQHVRRTGSLDDLRCDIWESDKELDAFLADLYASRRADVI